ncbi:V-set and transmembrane domain-containing protein 5-like [Engraulis encrasicolus]|uniref:V-set and transmembrane domain-containing protein 5-like n=1 Tax=Engraulis encrasicolus TaxID=184585 RepID=UPI002FD662E9
MRVHTLGSFPAALTHTLLALLLLGHTGLGEEGCVWGEVTESVLLPADISDDVNDSGPSPLLSWRVVTSTGSHPIVSWRPESGSTPNVSSAYQGRVTMHHNGSLTLSHLRLHDNGYYILTATDALGNTREEGLLLQVTEVCYEDLQYLAVFLLVLFAVSGSLMVSMWLLKRVVSAWKRKRHSSSVTVTLTTPQPTWRYYSNHDNPTAEMEMLE